MNNFVLSNGIKIPSIGYGTLNIPNGEQTTNAVVSAIENGYRHIDSAEVYGNDSSVGIAINQCGLPREQLFVTSKLSNDSRGYENTLNAFNGTLKRMGLDYLDLYLVHWPLARGSADECKRVNLDTWHAFEHLYKSGLVKAIGVSNFLEHHIQPLLEQSEIVPMVNQIEFHPGQMQTEIVDLCKAKNIQVEAWGPLGSGKMLSNDTLLGIAKNYNKSVAQICIKWCLQNDVLPLPKALGIDKMNQNLDVFDFELSVNDMNNINSIEYFGGSGLHPDRVSF